ncbi:MAG: HlyC/CorC family transporter [Candidatus Aminicenantes bacterium]|nr:HlyC/CorC family transporter [Candidatus Aminicenantes bacterium]
MLFPAIILFVIFLLLSAFFSSSETAFIASNPYKLDYLEKKGTSKAGLVKSLQKKVDDLLGTILFGNTLVNAAAASTATYIFVTFIPNKNQAVFFATLTTTFLVLILSEITPKTYAAYNPIKLSMLFARPLKFIILIFSPFVKTFTFLARILVPSSRKKGMGFSRAFDKEEVKILLTMGVKDMSSLRKKMIFGVLDIGSRPIKEIMIPRPQVLAVDIKISLKKLLDVVLSAGFSRFPVYKGRLDNIEGVVHARDLIFYVAEKKEFKIDDILRQAYFVPEYASLEKVLRLMQEKAAHLVFVVDEFGTFEGIVTLEDIIEEIVGEIQDEYDGLPEKYFTKLEDDRFRIKGKIPVKEMNHKLNLDLPLDPEYTTLAGFLLNEFGRIPKQGDILRFGHYQFEIEKMVKRQIHFVLFQREKRETEHTNETDIQE